MADGLVLIGHMIRGLVAAYATAAFPPIGTGPFWIIVCFYGVVTVLFDDETPRGIPGIDVILELRPDFRRDTD
jgi:hypothetical protein